MISFTESVNIGVICHSVLGAETSDKEKKWLEGFKLSIYSPATVLPTTSPQFSKFSHVDKVNMTC